MSRDIRIEVGRRSAWIRGWGMCAVADELDIPRMWCPRHKCLTVPVDRVDDILAVVETGRRRYVDLVAVDR